MGVLLFYRVDYDQRGRLNNVYSDKKGKVMTHLKYTAVSLAKQYPNPIKDVHIIHRFSFETGQKSGEKKVATAVFFFPFLITKFY